MSRELFQTALEFCHDLLAEWEWKKGERAGLGEEYNELAGFISKLNHEIVKPLPKPVAYAALDKDTGKAAFWSSRKENVESYIDGKDGFYLSAIYAEPPARSPIPDVEISKAFCDESGVSIGDTIEDAFEAGVRFGEQYHGIKEQD